MILLFFLLVQLSFVYSCNPTFDKCHSIIKIRQNNCKNTGCNCIISKEFVKCFTNNCDDLSVNDDYIIQQINSKNICYAHLLYQLNKNTPLPTGSTRTSDRKSVV